MSTNQSWGGRFAEGPREAVAAYTDSQTYDRALYAQDIRASQAHARMLGRQGIITPQEAETLVCGLNAVKKEIDMTAMNEARAKAEEYRKQAKADTEKLKNAYAAEYEKNRSALESTYNAGCSSWVDFSGPICSSTPLSWSRSHCWAWFRD